jgi:hypothetical protein
MSKLSPTRLFIKTVAGKSFGFNEKVDAHMNDLILEMKKMGAIMVDPANIQTTGQFGDSEYKVLLYEFKADLNAYLSSLAEDVTEDISGDHHIELRRLPHDLHRGVIDIHMRELDIGKFRGVQGDDFLAPHHAGFKHIGLVHRAKLADHFGPALTIQLRKKRQLAFSQNLHPTGLYIFCKSG